MPTTALSINEIRPHLYLSGYFCLTDKKLKHMGFTHAVDCTNLPKGLRVPGIEYFSVEVDDSEISNLKKYFDPSADFIRSARAAGGKCIVYCAAGISRSSSICMVYLMIHENLSLREAYHEVVRTRPIIAPNSGFWRQMIEYEEEKKGEASVTLLKGMRRAVPDVYLNKSKAINDLNGVIAKYDKIMTPKTFA